MTPVYHNETHDVKTQFETDDDHDLRWRRLIRGFARHGGRFVSIQRGSKGSGLRTGWNLPENALDERAALAALGRGRNIGLATGAGDIYCFDFDDDVDRALAVPELARSIRTYRRNAPGRAKIFFTCREKLPRRAPVRRIEVCGWTSNAKHWNAVIAGLHNSGAPIEWTGDELVELTGEQAAALWQQWTGTELWSASADFDLEIDPDAPTGDLLTAAIQRAGSIGRNNAGFALACALRDRHVAKDAAQAVMLAYQTAVTNPRDPYTATEAQTSLESAYNRPPRETDAPDPGIVPQLEALRTWIHGPSAAEEMRDAGMVRIADYRKVADAIIETCIRKRTPRAVMSVRQLGELVNASHMTAARHLARLFEGLRVKRYRDEAQPDGTTKRVRESVDLPGLHWLTVTATDNGASVIDLSPLLSREVDPSVTRSSPRHDKCTGVTLGSTYYPDHRADDAFVCYPVRWAAARRRRDDLLPSMNASTLSVLSTMAAADAPLTVAELVNTTGLTAAAVRASLKRAEGYGLTVAWSAGRANAWELLSDHEETLDELRPDLASYGLALLRMLRNATARGNFAQMRARSERDARERARMERRRGLYDEAATLYAERLQDIGFDWTATVPRAVRFGDELLDPRQVTPTGVVDLRSKPRVTHFDKAEEWSTWARDWWETLQALGDDMALEQKIHWLTLTHAGEDADAERYRAVRREVVDRTNIARRLAQRTPRPRPMGTATVDTDFDYMPAAAPTQARMVREAVTL